MMNLPTIISLLLALGTLTLVQETAPTFSSDFKSLALWEDDSTEGSPKSYKIIDKEKGLLRISTRAGTMDRVKIATRQKFSAGEYKWRVFVPNMGIGDQASIGAFLYQDDLHEIDFEIGYGTSKLRNSLGAKADELVCYLTSQGGPHSSTKVLLKSEKWYECSIKISFAKNDNYLIEWFLNDVKVKTLQTEFSEETEFKAVCSVENLSFLGDHLPTKDNYAIFDFFEFKETD
jgi:hypothetical protein